MPTPLHPAEGAALNLIEAMKAVAPTYEAMNRLARQAQGEFYAHQAPIHDCVHSLVVALLDAVLGDNDIASYFIFECNERHGCVTEADGKLWPMRSIDDLRAYVTRDQTPVPPEAPETPEAPAATRTVTSVTNTTMTIEPPAGAHTMTKTASMPFREPVWATPDQLEPVFIRLLEEGWNVDTATDAGFWGCRFAVREDGTWDPAALFVLLTEDPQDDTRVPSGRPFRIIDAIKPLGA